MIVFEAHFSRNCVTQHTVVKETPSFIWLVGETKRRKEPDQFYLTENQAWKALEQYWKGVMEHHHELYLKAQTNFQDAEIQRWACAGQEAKKKKS